jgi:hypothetical protein
VAQAGGHAASVVVVRMMDGAKPTRRKRLSRPIFWCESKSSHPRPRRSSVAKKPGRQMIGGYQQVMFAAGQTQGVETSVEPGRCPWIVRGRRVSGQQLEARRSNAFCWETGAEDNYNPP